MDATDSETAPPARSRAWPWMTLALVAACVLAYVLIVGGSGSASGTQGPAIGRHLLNFRLEHLTGASTDVSLDDLSGRVTLVNYWGTWCGPCQRELPHIVALASDFGSESDFRLYAVSCGDNGTDDEIGELRATTEEFLAANSVELPAYADQGASSRRALVHTAELDGGGFSYPTTVIFDRRGAIRGLWTGYSRGAMDEMRLLVSELLREPVVASSPAAAGG